MLRVTSLFSSPEIFSRCGLDEFVITCAVKAAGDTRLVCSLLGNSFERFELRNEEPKWRQIDCCVRCSLSVSRSLLLFTATMISPRLTNSSERWHGFIADSKRISLAAESRHKAALFFRFYFWFLLLPRTLTSHAFTIEQDGSALFSNKSNIAHGGLHCFSIYCL